MTIKHESEGYNNVSIDRASLEVGRAQKLTLTEHGGRHVFYSFVV